MRNLFVVENKNFTSWNILSGRHIEYSQITSKYLERCEISNKIKFLIGKYVWKMWGQTIIPTWVILSWMKMIFGRYQSLKKSSIQNWTSDWLGGKNNFCKLTTLAYPGTHAISNQLDYAGSSSIIQLILSLLTDSES